ncbi:MAG TPA: hypothetical protein PKZ53_12065 [Acidobacteriota bacterium]|nr:hypothetical protein [Acidobacteriota bacterium]
MVHHLSFQHLTQFDPGQPGITVPIKLQVVGKEVTCDAKLDTGATYCIFARSIGEQLGLVIEAGLNQRIETVTGSFLTFGHTITLSIFDILIDATIYFADDENFSRNVLGRFGWFDRLRVGLIDYDGELYLSQYHDPIE